MASVIVESTWHPSEDSLSPANVTCATELALPLVKSDMSHFILL